MSVRSLFVPVAFVFACHAAESEVETVVPPPDVPPVTTTTPSAPTVTLKPQQVTLSQKTEIHFSGAPLVDEIVEVDFGDGVIVDGDVTKTGSFEARVAVAIASNASIGIRQVQVTLKNGEKVSIGSLGVKPDFILKHWDGKLRQGDTARFELTALDGSAFLEDEVERVLFGEFLGREIFQNKYYEVGIDVFAHPGPTDAVVEFENGRIVRIPGAFEIEARTAIPVTASTTPITHDILKVEGNHVTFFDKDLFAITPAQDGILQVRSEDSGYPILLWDSGHFFMADGIDAIVLEDAASGTPLNYSMWRDVQAGETYYLHLKDRNMGWSGAAVTISMMEEQPQVIKANGFSHSTLEPQEVAATFPLLFEGRSFDESDVFSFVAPEELDGVTLAVVSNAGLKVYENPTEVAHVGLLNPMDVSGRPAAVFEVKAGSRYVISTTSKSSSKTLVYIP
jgi:hypothetical protein